MNFSFFNTIILIFFFYLFKSIIGGPSDVQCVGTNAADLPFDCVTIVDKKIIFTNYENDDDVFEKLSTIRRIEHGVEVVGTSLENFDYLANTLEIRNPNGPALIFRNNKFLKRITMQNLSMLSGKNEEVLFDKDYFPVEAFENSEALEDMLFLEATARAAHDEREQCSDEFIKIIPIDPSGFDWIFCFLIASCALMSLLIGYQVFRFLKLRKDSRRSERKKEGEESVQSPSPVKKNKVNKRKFT